MKLRPLVLAVFAVFALCRSASAQLTFNLIHAADMDAQVLAGFEAAAARWSAAFSDPITINLSIAFNTSPGTGVLGSTDASFVNIGYTDFRAALTSHRSSANDYTAVTSLPSGASYSLLLNHPNVASSTYTGSGDTLTMTVANARALGLYSGSATDAAITFNSTFNFDFNPSNGITGGAYDFVGVATHEIGHALGFFSGVDQLDSFPNLTAAQTIQTPLDFFRYSVQSTGLGLMDGAADTRAKYFSIDDGVTNLGGFSTGVTFGDSRQASHWKDGQGLGLMDPTVAPGELLTLTALDLESFDVIGYNLASVPEPAGTVACAALLAGAFVLVRRRKSPER